MPARGLLRGLSAPGQVGAHPRFYYENGKVFWGPHRGGIPEAFTRASRAWNGSRLVGNDVKRVYGLNTPSPAVFIEGQRTNILANSVTMSDFWLSSYRTTNFEAEYEVVDGVLEATWQWHEQGIGHTNARLYNSSYSIDTSKTYTFSFDIKFKDTAWSEVSVTVKGSVVDDVNYAEKQVARIYYGEQWLAQAGAQVSALPLPNGFTRVQVVMPPAVFTGSGSSLSMQVWQDASQAPEVEHGFWFTRPQLEEATFPSTYIPTEGAATVRTREVYRADAVAQWLDLGSPFTIACAYRLPYATLYGQGHPLSFARQAGDSPDGSAVIEFREGTDYSHQVRLGSGVNTSGQVSLGPAPHADDWTTSILTFDGSDQWAWYVNGQLLEQDTFAPTNQPDIFAIGSQAKQDKTIYGHIALGAAGLGIPFIDNREWSAQDVAERHTDWLSELQALPLALDVLP